VSSPFHNYLGYLEHAEAGRPGRAVGGQANDVKQHGGKPLAIWELQNRCAGGTDDFPIYLTRSLEKACRWLLETARGNRVASSDARRLRADGLGVTLSANELSDVANWYLLPKGDIRSSYALEVAANEYTCQGLELDYVGVCWDGDLRWDDAATAWKPCRLIGSRWQTVSNADAKRWAINKYRVLLTRARIGSIIWVPEGSTGRSDTEFRGSR
jgi:Uncharacterized conserved protein (DUF2075)